MPLIPGDGDTRVRDSRGTGVPAGGGSLQPKLPSLLRSDTRHRDQAGGVPATRKREGVTLAAPAVLCCNRGLSPAGR